MTGWRGRMAPSVCLDEPTTTERSTLRLFSIPSSIADNSLLRFPWGVAVGIPRPAIFTSDARKRCRATRKPHTAN